MAPISLRALLRRLGLGGRQAPPPRPGAGVRAPRPVPHAAEDAARRSPAAATGHAGPFSPAGLRVRFTRRAWASVLSETLTEVGTETGGILLGYRDGSDWLVVESIDPGPNSVFQMAYFEYDQPYVTHLANRISRLYERQLDVVGLWHRHPGSFDRFSGTDDGTNATYAQLNPRGALSGLINVDPEPRLTLFHVAAPLSYTHVPFEVLDWRESLDAAPLRDPRKLAATVARENARALSGEETATGTIEVAAPELPLETLAARWAALVASDAVPAAPGLVRDLAVWTDDELAAASDELQGDAAFLAERGVSLSMRAGADDSVALSATRGGERLGLGALALDRASGRLLLLVPDDASRALPYSSGRIERALRERP